MGTIGSAPSPPGGSGRGRSAAGWIVAGILAVALAAFVAFEAGKRSGTSTAPAARAAVTAIPAASVEPPAPTPLPESRFEHAEMVVTVLRPSPSPGAMEAAAINPAPTKAPEGLHERMTRCLSFRMADDESNATYMPQFTQVLVTVKNLCDFSFVGSEVWFEARVSPARGEGTAARVTERFQNPIPARGSTDVRLYLDCSRCYPPAYRYEARLWWASGGGRTE